MVLWLAGCKRNGKQAMTGWQASAVPVAKPSCIRIWASPLSFQLSLGKAHARTLSNDSALRLLEY